MDIEVYISGDSHPQLYDAYIDKDGTIFVMDPPPPAGDDTLMQVVLESDVITPTVEQRHAVNFLLKMNNGKVHLFFQDRFMFGHAKGA